MDNKFLLFRAANFVDIVLIVMTSILNVVIGGLLKVEWCAVIHR